MLNNPIHCSFDFLKDFLTHESRKESFIPSDEEVQRHANWGCFQGFLLHNTLSVKESREEISDSIRQSSSSTLEKEMASRVLDSLGPIYKTVFKQNYCDPLHTKAGAIQLQSCFSIEEENYSKLAGVLSLTPDEAIERVELYTDSGVALSKKDDTSWEEIVQACLPYKRFSSLIIIDNYAPKGGERNLGQLLNNLLPDDIDKNTRFNLTIVCNGKSNDGTPVYLDHNAELALTETNILNHYLRDLPYRDRIDIALVYSDYYGKSPFHDRVIITDYNFVIAPGGLDLLYEDGTSSKLTIIYGLFPDFIQQSQRKTPENMVKVDYMYRNLNVLVNRFRMTKAMNNPIVRQYLNTL